MMMMARLWAMLFGVLMMMMSHGLQNTLITLRAVAEDFDPAWVGIIVSSYYIGLILASVTMTKLVERVGHVRVFAALAAVASAVSLLTGMYVSEFGWVVARIVSGIAITGMAFVCEAWVQGFATNQNRGYVFAIYMTHIFVGLAGGQLLLIGANVEDITLFALVSVVFSLAVLPMLLSARAKPKPMAPSRRNMSLAELLTTSPLGFFGIFLIGGLHATIYAILPIYATFSGISTNIIAYGMSLLIAGGAAAQIPFGKLSDLMDRRWMLLGCGTISAMVMLPLIWLMPNNFTFLAISLGMGIFVLPLYPICVSHVNDRVTDGQRLRITSVVMMVNGTGCIIAPLVTGLMISNFGPKAFFVYAVGICGTLSLLLISRMVMRKPVKHRTERRYLGVPFSARPSSSQNLMNEVPGRSSVINHSPKPANSA